MDKTSIIDWLETNADNHVMNTLFNFAKIMIFQTEYGRLFDERGRAALNKYGIQTAAVLHFDIQKFQNSTDFQHTPRSSNGRPRPSPEKLT